MESLYQFHNRHVNAVKSYSKKRDIIRKKIKELEEEENKMSYPHFRKMLEKFSKRVMPEIKGATKIETFGPFGLGCETSVYFQDKDGKSLASATFTSGGDGYRLKDYSKNTNLFAKGTIGEVNGGNYNSIEITEDMTVDWFIKFMKRNRNY